MTSDHTADSQNQQSNGEHQYTHLVILCGHAIYHGSSGSDPRQESTWALKPFQKGTPTKSGEHAIFLQHAFAAVQQINSNTLVAFSGGPTDANYPSLSEARSYLNALKDWAACIKWDLPLDLLEGKDSVLLLEENATDSYQNVIFSILEFRRRAGVYPQDLTIISQAFKSERFLDLHARALKWPADRVKILGISPPFSKAELDSTIRGEEKNGYSPWTTDLYGTGNLLSGKRKQRGWKDEKTAELGAGFEDVIKKLLAFESNGGQAFPEKLPWE